MSARQAKTAVSDQYLDPGGGGNDWQVQSPEDILIHAEELVHRRRPAWGTLDDSLLVARQDFKDRSSGGCHIILPDNRVRAMEDQLSQRVRAQLLGEQGPEMTPLAPKPIRRRKEADSRPRAPPKPRTPWYLPAEKWFSKEASGEDAEKGGGFPYDGRYNARQAAEEEGNVDGGPPSQKEKDSLQIVEAYKQYMKEDKRMVAKCQDVDEAVRALTGEYAEQKGGSSKDDRKVYKKAAGRAGEVFLSYWGGKDGHPYGWWFSSKHHGGTPYAYCPSDASSPPMSNWRVPWDEPSVRLSFQVKEKSQRKPAFLQ